MTQLHKSGPKWVMYSSMGLELGLSVVVGFLIGSWLDEWLATEPWFLLVFGIAGIVAGYRSIFRLVKRVQADSKFEKDN
jgi:ATP synthase protein I